MVLCDSLASENGVATDVVIREQLVCGNTEYIYSVLPEVTKPYSDVLRHLGTPLRRFGVGH